MLVVRRQRGCARFENCRKFFVMGIYELCRTRFSHYIKGLNSIYKFNYAILCSYVYSAVLLTIPLQRDGTPRDIENNRI